MNGTKWMCLVCVMVCFAVVRAEEPEAIYKKGTAVYKSDPAAAFGFFLKAAEAGHVSAMTGAGYCLETGTGTAVDYAKAIEWYEKAAQQNSLKACEGLARIYASCDDPQFHDGEKAVKFASVVARGNPRDAEAHSLLAGAYVRNKEFRKAGAIARRALGAVTIKHEQKQRLLDLRMGKPHPSEASDVWIFQAAEKGSAWAMATLGRRHEDKQGKMYDLAKARFWYEKAALLDVAVAQYRLGVMYAKGIGVGEDKEKAFALLKSAFGQGCEEARLPLAEMYAEGAGVERDYREALKLYEGAAADGDQLAAKKAKDLKRFEDLFDKLENGSGESLYERGREYQTDRDGGKDVERALLCYQAAARQGFDKAMSALGGWYEYGYDGTRDLEKALHWYREAAAVGSGKAAMHAAGSASEIYAAGDDVSLHDGEQALKYARMYERMLTSSSYRYLANHYMAMAYARNGEFNDAVRCEEQAIRLYERTTSSGAYLSTLNMCLRLFEQGKPYVKSMPTRSVASSSNPLFAEAYQYYSGKGVSRNYRKALSLFLKAYESEKYSRTAYYIALMYSVGYGKVDKDIGQALAWYEKALAFDDGRYSAYAARQLGEIYSIYPESSYGNGALAVKYALIYESKMSERYATDNKKASGSIKIDYRISANLAMAYARNGQFDIAIEYQKKAIKLLDAQHENEGRKELKERLELYKQGQPFTRSGKEN
ncbi:MAG: sel1 repeat family protein [Kiritimatiellales bacterium]|nr:sel1 repeat family protein [Kiritimatiellales bacterium]